MVVSTCDWLMSDTVACLCMFAERVDEEDLEEVEEDRRVDIESEAEVITEDKEGGEEEEDSNTEEDCDKPDIPSESLDTFNDDDSLTNADTTTGTFFMALTSLTLFSVVTSAAAVVSDATLPALFLRVFGAFLDGDLH